MGHSPTNLQHLIPRLSGKWTTAKDFYEALHVHATKIDSLDKEMLENECLKMDILRAAKELFAPKEDS